LINHRKLLDLASASLKKFSPTKKAAHTLLFITEEKTFRIDTDSNGVFSTELEVIEQGCPASASLPRVINKLADKAASPWAKSMWILYSRLSTLLVSLPEMQVKGLDKAMLAQVLLYEAEGMTGQVGTDNLFAYQFVKAEDEMADYWLTQIDLSVWNELSVNLKKQKSKLAGLLSPAGLLFPLQYEEADQWLRIESWPNQLVAVAKQDNYTNMNVISYDSPRWRPELEHWLAEKQQGAATETLLTGRLDLLPDTQALFDLNNSDDAALWMLRWANELIVEEGRHSAVIRQPSAINPEHLWLAGSGTAATVLCLLNALWFIHERNVFDAEAENLRAIEKNIQDLNKRIGDVSAEQSKIEQKLQQLSSDNGQIPLILSYLKQRDARLLKALADGRSEQLIIETITSNGASVVIEGVSLQQELANKLADSMAQPFKDSPWRIESPTVKNMALMADGNGPWSMVIKLVDAGVPALNPKPAEPQNKKAKK